MTPKRYEDLLTWMTIGCVVGAATAYGICVLYAPDSTGVIIPGVIGASMVFVLLKSLFVTIDCAKCAGPMKLERKTRTWFTRDDYAYVCTLCHHSEVSHMRHDD